MYILHCSMDEGVKVEGVKVIAFAYEGQVWVLKAKDSTP